MKNVRGYLWAALLTAIATMMLTSCASDADLYDYVCSDDVVIAQCDLAAIIDNTGSEVKGDGVRLSPSLQKLSVYMVSGRDRQHLDNLLAVEGIDLSNVVIAVDRHMEAFVTMRVTDRGKMEKYLQKVTYGDMTHSNSDGYDIYKLDDKRTVFVAGSTACMMVADRSVDVSDIKARGEAAHEKPLLSWWKKTLEQGTTLNMLMNLSEYTRLVESNFGYGFSLGALKVGYDDAQLEHAFAKINISLKGVELQGTLAMVDENDKPLESKYADIKIDPSLLKYASAEDMLVTMTAVPKAVDWNKILNQLVLEMGGYRNSTLDQSTVEAIGNVLSDIDGTVMLAAGPKNLLKINSADGWDAVLAAQMKPGMADKYVSQVKSLIDVTNAGMADLADQYAALGYRGYKPRQVTYAEADGDLVISIPSVGKVYVKVIDDTLVASLAPVTERGDCAVAESEFDGMSSGTIVRMPRHNPFSSIMQLPFGIDMTYLSDSRTARFVIKETDTEGLMLENIFKLIAGQSR